MRGLCRKPLTRPSATLSPRSRGEGRWNTVFPDRSSLSFEDEQMLRGQSLDLLDELEARGRPFGEDLLRRHAVFAADVVGGTVLGAIFDERHAAVWLQRFA